VLTRREGQRIGFADDVVITVIGTRPGSVHLGIEAPSAVAIAREDAYSVDEYSSAPRVRACRS